MAELCVPRTRKLGSVSRIFMLKMLKWQNKDGNVQPEVPEAEGVVVGYGSSTAGPPESSHRTLWQRGRGVWCPPVLSENSGVWTHALFPSISSQWILDGHSFQG